MAYLYLGVQERMPSLRTNFNLAHQIWRQAQSSELSDTILGRFGFLLSCGIGLRTQKKIHLKL